MVAVYDAGRTDAVRFALSFFLAMCPCVHLPLQPHTHARTCLGWLAGTIVRQLPPRRDTKPVLPESMGAVSDCGTPLVPDLPWRDTTPLRHPSGRTSSNAAQWRTCTFALRVRVIDLTESAEEGACCFQFAHVLCSCGGNEIGAALLTNCHRSCLAHRNNRRLGPPEPRPVGILCDRGCVE